MGVRSSEFGGLDLNYLDKSIDRQNIIGLIHRQNKPSPNSQPRTPNFIKKHHHPFPFPLLSGITSERIVDRTNYEHAKIR
jgi:hypothetical protein